MYEPTTICLLRMHRAALGLSQGQLAERVGVSRQALIAIEAGRQIPSTTLSLLLARALSCQVDDLFQLARSPPLTASLAPAAPGARPTRRVLVGRVDDAWVAHPTNDDARAADALVVAPLEGGKACIEMLWERGSLEQTVLVAGCAPLLGVLAQQLDGCSRGARATWIPADSERALGLLAAGQVHLAGLHLADAQSPEAHADVARRVFPGQRTTLINLARWRQGLVVAAGNPLGLRSAADLVRPGVRCVQRSEGAAAQRLLVRLLGACGASPHDLTTPPQVAQDHEDVARLVRWGVADVGVAIEAAASAQRLDFVPLSEERFDLLVPERRLQEAPVARLVERLGRPAFRAEAHDFPGYDLREAGHALTVSSL